MLVAGESFKAYRILEFIGAGGSGSVYRAMQEGLEREVALKIVDLGGRTAAEDRKRFLREARSLARLSHPCIIRLYDYGEEESRVYYSMEFAPGSSLDRRLRQGKPFESREAVEILHQVLEALEMVHDVGVLHRDVKPANVLVRPNGTILLSDFGLARESNSTRLTRAGSLLGTLPYLPPEIFGMLEPDTRGDLYQGAILLYELLHGTVPYSGPEVLEMMKGKLLNPQEPIAALGPGVGEGLRAFLKRGMDPDPERRFQSAREMNAALGVRAGGKTGNERTSGTRQTPSAARSGPKPAPRVLSGQTRPATSAPRAAVPPGPPARISALTVVAAVVGLSLAGVLAIGFALRPSSPTPSAPPKVVRAKAAEEVPAGPPSLTSRRLELAGIFRDRLLAERDLPLTRTGNPGAEDCLETAVPASTEIVEAQLLWSKTSAHAPAPRAVNGTPVRDAAALAGLLVDGNNRIVFAPGCLAAGDSAVLRIRRREGARLALPTPIGPESGALAAPGTPLGDLMQTCRRQFEYGRHTEVMEATEKAVQIAPWHWEAQWRRGFALHLSNNVFGEINKMGNSLSLIGANDSDPEKLRQEAFGHLDRALELNPPADIVWHDLGLCYRNDRRYADAARMLQFACTMNQSTNRYWWELVLVLTPGVPRGHESTHPLTPFVLSIARAALDRRSMKMPAWFLERGNLFRQYGLPAEARDDYLAALDQEPSNAHAKAALESLGRR